MCGIFSPRDLAPGSNDAPDDYEARDPRPRRGEQDHVAPPRVRAVTGARLLSEEATVRICQQATV